MNRAQIEDYLRWLREQVAIEQSDDHERGNHPQSKLGDSHRLDCTSTGLNIAIAELERRMVFVQG